MHVTKKVYYQANIFSVIRVNLKVVRNTSDVI